MSFVHLHVHSCYSLLDGMIKLPDLVTTAKSMGMPAVALTDHGQMYGLWPFYKEAIKAGIKPILGVEAYVATQGRFSRPAKGEKRLNHLVLLAQNLEGYHNLCRLVSRANTEGFYYKPRVDFELLEEYKSGIIALSACLQGEVASYILAGHLDKAEEAAANYARIYKDHFYLELQENTIPEQNLVNEGLLALSKKMGLPMVATNDCHYLLKEHSDAHEVLLCIQTKSTLNDPNRLRFGLQQLYLKSPEEMKAAFSYCPEAIDNTLAIADLCQVEFPKKFPYVFPKLKTKGETPAESLANLAREGLDKRLAVLKAAGQTLSPETIQNYRTRLESEIATILEMGFPGYFLIVADFIGWAKDHNIPVGPGRGSAAGSLVAWALRITDIDPIKYDLLFERFLNIERISMPDIDVDFCAEGRGEVLKYVTETYGSDHVAQILTLGQLKAKAAIKDVGRVLGMPLSDVTAISNLIPPVLNITITKAMEEEPRMAAAYKKDPMVKKMLDFALLVENLPRHSSTHASGVVIGDRPLMEHLPLCCDAKSRDENGKSTQVITQFELKGVEDCGLVKFDFLGLKNLTIINHCLELLAQRNIKIDLVNLDLEDEATYQLLCRGEVSGVFQLESSGIREILLKLKPTKIQDIIALLALYRPGPLKGGLVHDFIDIKHGRKKAQYILPELEPILAETNGIILYQEQVMRISQLLASYSLGEADILRRAMGKKDSAEMARQKSRFLDGAKANQVDLAKAETIFDLMESFAEYGFNKSHSAAYAILTFQTAWLKAHYPVEFMAALMSSVKGDQDKVARLISERRDAGRPVLPPDVNVSGYNFSVRGQDILFGLGAVKGLGQGPIDSIIEARSKEPFLDLFDFCERVASVKVTRRVVETLIKCGALDQTGGQSREVMLAALDEAYVRPNREKDMGGSLFDCLPPPDKLPTRNWPKVPAWADEERLNYEKELLGFYLTGHPLERFEPQMKALESIRIAQALKKPNLSEVKISGVLTKISFNKDKKDREYAFATLEDLSGSIELTIWNSTLKKIDKKLLVPESMVTLKGNIEQPDDENSRFGAKIEVREMLSLEKAIKTRTKQVVVKTPLSTLKPVQELLKKQPVNPNGPVFHLNIHDGEGEAIYRLDARLALDGDFINQAYQILHPYGSVICSEHGVPISEY